MKTSMNLYFNTTLDTKLKFDTIKAVGFDEFFTGIYDEKETMSFAEQMQYAQQIGLACTMVHCSYESPLLDAFWLDSEDGETVTRDYLQQINQCGKYTKNFVVHLNASTQSTVSEIGLVRLQRLLKECEKYNLNLCIENLFSVDEIPYIFSHIKHPLLKICYDSGHKNWLTPNFDVCGEYGKYISVLHLHENDGSCDQHKTLSVGSSVYNQLCHDLQNINPEVVLASEARVKHENWQDYLKQDVDSLTKLSAVLSQK